MAAVSARYTRILVDQFDFSGDSNRVIMAGTVATLDTTGFQAVTSTSIPGNLQGASIQHGGYYAGADAGELEYELKQRLGSATPAYIAALFGTNQAACPAYVCDTSWGQQLTVDAPIDGLITLSGNWPAGGGMKRGLRIQAGASTLSGTGGGTAYDFGAAGAAGGTGYLFVQTITGTATGATIDIESSATEGGTYASEGTFTFSAVGVQTLTMSGVVNQWLRINTTSLGGATSFAVVCIACVAGVTQ